MPAIRYLNGRTLRTINQYRDLIAHRLECYASGSKVVRPRWHGFTCNAGAAFLKNGKIVRIVVDAISASDGTNAEGWVELPDSHFALGWWIPPATLHGADEGDVYGLVDDNGWPMTTLRYTDIELKNQPVRAGQVFS